MSLVAVDVNASRVRVVQGVAPREARPVLLEGTHAELPLALSLEGRSPAPGRAGIALRRRSPHLACTTFLPYLGENREWSGPRCRIDATRALTMVLDVVSGRVGRHGAVALAIPSYLLDHQRHLLHHASELAKLKTFGSVETSLPAVLAAHTLQPWQGRALVVDVDEHALTWSVVATQGVTAALVQVESHPTLGLLSWYERALAAVADGFVFRHRRDPRDSADVEQSLYDQLDRLFEECQHGKAGEVIWQTSTGTHLLTLNASDLLTACNSLLERTLQGYRACLDATEDQGPVRSIVVTAAAARLPNLTRELERLLAEDSLRARTRLSEDVNDAPAHVRVLPADAVVHAAHELTARWFRKELPQGHLEVVPLLDMQPPSAGLARLHFRGRDHLLKATALTLGRDPRCDVVFDTQEFPSVSAEHCRIAVDQETFLLLDTSRHGTFVNDRPVPRQKVLQPGDWLRLGPGGPLLRFLGSTIDPRKMMTTA